MAKYNIGDEVVLVLSNEDAYYAGLREKISPEELEVLREVRWGDSDYWEKCSYYRKQMKFYGEVITIQEWSYSNGLPCRLIHFKLDNGCEIGFFESDRDLRKANILEKITMRLKHSVKPLNKLAACLS